MAPALFLASLRFRMANTSWRGLRFHFSAAACAGPTWPAARAVASGAGPRLHADGPEPTHGTPTPWRPRQVEATSTPEQAEDAGAPGVPNRRKTPRPWAARRRARRAGPHPNGPAAMGFAVLGSLALMLLILGASSATSTATTPLGDVQTRLKTDPAEFYLLLLKAAACRCWPPWRSPSAITGLAAPPGGRGPLRRRAPRERRLGGHLHRLRGGGHRPKTSAVLVAEQHLPGLAPAGTSCVERHAQSRSCSSAAT